MAELKTKRNKQSVTAFIKTVDPARQKDCRTVMKMMREATGAKAEMWGASIVGFGSCHYTYASGREGDWMQVGFSPRKQNLTLYIMPGFKRYAALMKKLGKHKTGKSCLYIKSLEDVDLPTLRALIEQSVAHMQSRK